MSIVLRFSTTPSFLSWAVRTRTWSPYSHVDFVLPNGFYLGSVPFKGVCVHDTVFPIEDYFKLETTEEQSLEIMNRAWAELGKPYDIWGALGFVIDRDWQDPSKWFCSEHVANSIQPIIPLFNETPNKITPRDLSIHSLFKKISKPQ